MKKKKIGIIISSGIILSVLGFGFYSYNNPTPQQLADHGELNSLKDIKLKKVKDSTNDENSLDISEKNTNKSISNDKLVESNEEKLSDDELLENKKPEKIEISDKEKQELQKKAKSFYAYIKNDSENNAWDYDVFQNFIKVYEEYTKNNSNENFLALQENLDSIAVSFKTLGYIE